MQKKIDQEKVRNQDHICESIFLNNRLFDLVNFIHEYLNTRDEGTYGNASTQRGERVELASDCCLSDDSCGMANLW